jgi:hypothetical protein
MHGFSLGIVTAPCQGGLAKKGGKVSRKPRGNRLLAIYNFILVKIPVLATFSPGKTPGVNFAG